MSVNRHNQSTWHHPLWESTVQYKVEGGVRIVEDIRTCTLGPCLHLMPCSAIENMNICQEPLCRNAPPAGGKSPVGAAQNGRE